MDQAVVPTNDAIERVLNMLRERLESAIQNGQRVRMDAREGMRSQKIPTQAFERASFSELLKLPQRDGSYELHIYIEPER